MVALVCGAGTSQLSAATFFWDADSNGSNSVIGGSGNWDTTSNNWDPDAADNTNGNNTTWNNAGNDIAVFAGTAGTVTLTEAITAGGLTFNTTGYTITGDTLTLSAPTGSTSPVILVDGLGTRTTIDSILAGTGGFLKAGNGSLVLGNNSNSFSGDLAIKAGNVVISNTAQLGTGTTAIAVQGIANTGSPGFTGGSLVLAGTTPSGPVTLTREVSFSGRGPGAANQSGGLISVGNNIIAGGLTAGSSASEGRMVATHGITTISGGINLGTGGALGLQGNGNWIVSGVVTGSEVANDRFFKAGTVVTTTLWLQNAGNNFNDSIRIDSGTVRVSTNAALGMNLGTQSLDFNGGRLEVRSDAPNFSTRNINIRGNTSQIFLDRAIGGSGLNQTFVFGNLNNSAANGGLTAEGRDGNSLTITGPMSATLGTNVISWINGGTLAFTNSGNGLYTINASINRLSETTARTLTLAATGEMLLTGNILQTGTGAVSLSKTGTGTLTILGTASTATGTTTVNDGTLTISSFNSLPSGALLIGNATTTPGAITYTGAGETLSKAITFNTTTANVYLNASGSGALTVTGAITGFVGAGGNKSLVLGGTSAAANEIQSVITNNTGAFNNSLQKIDSGTWVLSGANLYGGTTTISNGTLQIKDTFSGTSRNVIASTAAVIFNVDTFSQAAGGTLEYLGDGANASAEAVGALTITAGANTIKATAGAGGTAALTFASLGTVSAGAGMNFVTNAGGAVTLTGATNTNGILNAHLFYNGADFASGSTVGAAAYTVANSGASLATLNTLPYHVNTTDITAQATASLRAGIKFSDTRNFTLAGGATLTLNNGSATTSGGLLVTGGSTVTISGGTGISTGGANDLVFRTDGVGDTLILNTPILAASTLGWTKLGAGTLVLGAANAGTTGGLVHIDEGTVQMSGSGRLGADSMDVRLRQGATLDLNGVSLGTVASGTGSIDEIIGAGTLTNTGALASIRVGNANGGSQFTGSITGLINLVKNGSGTFWLEGPQTYAGVVTLSAGNLDVTSLANIGSASGLGTGDASSNATNAASLVFNGGALRYIGQNAGNTYLSTQTPSVSIDRLFTLAGDGTIASFGSYGQNDSRARAANHAALVFSNTADVAFTGAGVRTLTLRGDSLGDNFIGLKLVNNTNVGEALNITKADGGMWILGNAANSYSGTTSISGGALRAQDGASLPTASNLFLSGGVLESSGTFNRGALGTAAGQYRFIANGNGGFSAGDSKLTVDFTPLSTPTWGSTTNFLNAGVFILNSSTSLADVEVTGNFNLVAGAAAAVNATTTAGSATVNLTVGNTNGMTIGQAVTGNANIPAGAYVASITSATQFTLNTGTGVLAATGIATTVNAGGWREIQVNDNTSTNLDFATILGVIGGTGGLGKVGGGPLILGNANTYSGNTVIRNETVFATSIGAAGDTSSSFGTNVGGGIVELGNPGGSNTANLMYVGQGEITTRQINLTGTTGTRRIDSSGSGPLILTNLINSSAASVNTTSGARTLEIRGTNTDGNMITSTLGNDGANVLTVTKSDGGVWILNPSAANTFTGAINSVAGMLGLTSNGIGAASTIALNNGGIFAYGTPLTTSTGISGNNSTGVFGGANAITINANVTKTAGNNQWTISNNLEGGALLTINGNFINLEAGGTAATQTISIRGYGSTLWNGAITENAAAGGKIAWNIAIANDASFTMAGAAANTYTGGTTLSQGTLNLNKTGGASNLGTGAFAFNGGVVEAGTALIGGSALPNAINLIGDPATFSGTNSIELTGLLTNNGGNRLLFNNLSGGATLTLTGNVSLSNDNTGRTLTMRGTGDTLINGVVQNGGTGAGALAYSAVSGSLTLTGLNTATGALTANRNTITLSGANGRWAGSAVVNPLGVITLDNSTNENLDRLQGTFTGAGGTLNFIGDGNGTAESIGALTINSVQTYITMSGAGPNVLTFASANFANTGSSLNLNGVPGLGTTNQVKFTTFTGSANAAVVSGGIMPRVFIGGTDFATYDAAAGVKAFTAYDTSNSLAPIAPVLTTTTGTRTNTSAVVTMGSTAGITPFMSIAGAGIPAGTYVVSVDSGTQLTLSQNATSTAAGTADFIVNEIHVMELTASVNLAGNATRDAIKINGSGLTIGGAATNRLTLTAGAILNTGGDNTLSTPHVNLGANVGYIQVASGTTLTVDSALYGVVGWAKTLSGTLVLNTPTYISSTTNLLNGTTRLVLNGLNTLFPNQLLNINDGATLDLNGGTQFVGQLSDPGTMPGAGGIITTSTGTATFVTNMAGSSLFSGAITGAVNFGRTNGNTLTINSAQTYTGSTTLLGGTTTLESDGTILGSTGIAINASTLFLSNNTGLQTQNNNRIGDTLPISLRDGIISVTGRVSTAATEAFGALTSAQGANTITATVGGGTFNSLDLTFASLTRNSGTTLNFTGTNLGQGGNSARIMFTTPLTAVAGGALGGWAIANSTDFAAYNTALGVGVVGMGGFAGYDSTFGSGNITEIPSAPNAITATTLGAGTTTTALLRLGIGSFNNIAFTGGADILNLEQGGLLRANINFGTSIGTATTRGVLTAGGSEVSGTRELTVFNNGAANPTFANAVTTIGSPVVTGINTQGLVTGMSITGTGIPAGTKVVSIDNTGQVTLSANATAAGTVTLTAGALDGGSTTNLSSIITMASTVGVTPGMTLTGTGIPTGTYVVSVDSATQLTLSQNATATAAGTITFTAGLSNVVINSVIADNGFGNSVNLVKSGAGVLALSANNTYTGGTTVVQGTVNLVGSGVVIPGGGVILGGAAMTMLTNAGQIDPSNDVTLRRSSTLTMVGNNSLKSLIFENNGGTGNPTVTSGGILTLTDATPITVTSSNPVTVATIAGSLNLGTGAKTIDTPAIQISGDTVTNLTPTLNISAAILSPNVSLTKSGNGVLQLSGQSTFNGLSVTGGGILISGNSSPTAGGGGLVSGPLGAGTVAMSAGTTILVDASRTLGNDITFAGTPTFDSTANTAWTLTLNGAISGAGLSATPTIQINNPFLTVALLGNLGTITSISKTGLGALIFNATNYSGDFGASALGNPNAVSLLHDGTAPNVGRGNAETIALGNVIFDAGIIPAITLGRAGGLGFLNAAANKILAPTSLSNVGLGLTITNNNGYGLQVADAASLTNTPTFFVNTATASNVTQGLYLGGDLTGTGFIKTGAGTLVLNNATPIDNTFTGNISINQGVVSVNDDGQLGNASNQVRLSPTTGTSTLRATGTFATSRVIDLSVATSLRAIEVTSGNTLTLNAGFGLTAAAAGLIKADRGILTLAAANSGWSGPLTISGGAVNTSLASSLGTGAIIINNPGAALQLQGDITVANAITIDVLANGQIMTGLLTGGAIQSVGGSNTISSAITVNATHGSDNQTRSFGFGADSGATLNLGTVNFAHPNTGTNRNIIAYFGGAGSINVSGVIDNTNGTPGANTFIFKYGNGTMNLTGANAIPDSEVRIYRGGMTLSGAATFGSGPGAATQVQVWQNGTLNIDNSGTNTANRVSNRVVQIGGGTINYTPNAAGSTQTSTGALQISQGTNTINLNGGGNQTITFASLTQNGGATLNVTGTFGTASNKLTFTTAPTLSPGTTGLLARVLTNGTEFATYAAATGIGTFTGYAAVSNILSAAATQSFNATDLTANSLTSSQTLNALKITSGAGSTNVGGLAGLNPTTLTLTSGGILVNGTGTTSTLAVPIVTFGTGATEAVIHVLAGQTLNVTSGLVTTGGLTKSSDGTLNLNSQQFINASSFVNGGTLNLQSGATNTLLFNTSLGVNHNAIVDLKNGVQFIQSLFSANAGGNTDLGGGTVTNSGAEATLVTNSNSNFNGSITGTIYLNKTGTGALNLQNANNYTGATLLNGGTITLQDLGTLSSTSAITINRANLTLTNNNLYSLTDRVNNAAAITLNGGVIALNGRAQADVSETLGAVTIEAGHNGIFPTLFGTGVNMVTLNLGGLTRTAGSTATLRFNSLGAIGLIGNSNVVMVAGGVPLTNNIIGPWAIVDREYATYDNTFGISALGQTGMAAYAGGTLNSNPLATDNIRYTTTGTTIMLSDVVVNTLNLNQSTSNMVIDLNSKTLRLQGGGLLIGQNTDATSVTISSGTITSGTVGAASDFYLIHAPYSNNTRNAVINAVIADNDASGPVRLILSGGDASTSTLTLNGTNTYTGGTVINQGVRVLGASGSLGTGGITVHQATFTQTAGGVIPTQALTMTGGSTVTLAGNNTLTGISFIANGGAAPTLNPTGILTLTGGITSTPTAAGGVAIITNGNVNLNGAGSYSMDVGATLVNGKDVAPWQAGLIINSVIDNGGIVKTGNGMLQFGGQNTFTGGVTVNAGGIILGASSTPSGIGETVITGPLGTGTLTMANGTSMVATVAAIVSNNVVFGDDGFGVGSHVFNGLQNITLNGLTTLPATWNATITAPQTTLTIADASGSTVTDVINKSGLGLLVMGAYNGTVQATGGLVFAADGNTLGTSQNVALGGDLILTGDTAITVNRSGAAPNARNKILQKVNLTVPGNIMSVSNQSGYGLEFTGTTTMTGPAHFAVGVASASNVVQGLILSGVVDDGASDFGIIKSGPGTLVLNGANTFGGTGNTIDILNGVVSVNSDAGLGAAGNSITLNVDNSTGVGLRATDSFSTAREIILNQLNNAIEVVQGKTLTLTNSFTLAAVSNTLFKNDSGILAINADNSTWTGGITINGGVLRLGDANAAGSGTISISPLSAATGSALQLSGGISISNAITLQGTNNQTTGGINNGGQLESFSGVNTVTGVLTMSFDAAIGAQAGATLNIDGGINNPTATGRAVHFTGGGIINLNSNVTSGTATANQYFALRKYGTGTLNITTALSLIPTDANSGLQLFGGTIVLKDNGTLTGGNTVAFNVLPGATLSLDNSVTNIANRLGERPVTLSGGNFSYLSNSGTSTETLGGLTVLRPAVTITADNNGGSSTITFASLAGTTANIVQLDAALNFVNVGAAFGTTGANSNRIIFTTAPTLTNSIIQRATINGVDFATHGANGIAAFAGYNTGSTTDINGVTATTGTVDANAAMTTKNITASRTFNALRLSGATGQTVSGNALTTLTLGAGAVLATGGGNHQITAPILAMSGIQGFISVDTGTTLEITSVLTGSAGWIKAGAGTLTLTPPSSPILNRTANTITGNATITGGTVILNGGNNTLVANQNLQVGPGGTLDLNGNSQYVGILFTDSGVVEGAGGIITGGANTGSTLVVNQGAADRNWAGTMTGAMSFLRTGVNTLLVFSNNDYTGSTLIGGGATTLRDGGRLSGTSDIEIVYATLNIDNNVGLKDLADRVNDAATISLRGGTLSFTGRAQTASSETVGVVTLNKSNSFITSIAGGTGVNSADLILSGLNRSVGGGTVNFTASNSGGQIGSNARIITPLINGVSTATAGGGLTNNLIGGWAIFGTSDFATYIPGLGVAAMGAPGAYAYSNATSTPGTLNAAGMNDNISINVAVTGNTLPVTNDLTINSLRIGNIAAQTVAIAAGKTLTLSSGGLLFFSTATQTIGSAVNQGNLTTTGPELFIYTQGTGPQVINSVITGAITVVKSGANPLTLNGANTYTGGTTINQGTLTLGATSNIPLATDPALGLVLNGVTFGITNAGQIASGNIVTLNGPSTLNLVGANTLAGLVFRDDGGGTTASAVSSNSGTLTLNGNIVSTTANPASTSIINGRVDFGATQRTLDISATRFNNQELAALLSDFNLQGVTGSAGGIIKAGDGVLQFNAQAVYSGATTVNNGRIQIGLANGGSRFSAYNLTTASTGLNLNGLSTVLGSLEGAGYVINTSTTAGTLTVGYNGSSTTFNGSFLRFNDATLAPINLTKIGAGTMTLTSNANTSGGTLTINRGGVTYKDAGTRNFITGATVVNEGGTLTLDNTGTVNVNNRLNSTIGITLNGGTFNLLGRDSTATTETVAGVLTLGPSASLINLTAGSGGSAILTFTSLTQNAGSTAIVSGTNLGTDTKLIFTTAPTEVPATTGILARIAVGADFATYDTVQGVIAFTGYTTPTDINGAAGTATIKIDGTTTVRDLNLARTINAMNIIADGVTIGSNGTLLLTQGWTITSGGVLVNGNNATLSTPVLAFGGTEGIFRINGSSLNVSSSITGTAGITKTGAGSMTLSGLQSYTGQTALNLGNLTLAGGNNTLLVAPTGTIPTVADLQINGGVLDLNGNHQAVRTLLNSNTLAFIAGEITNSSLTPVTLTTAMNANSTFGAKISGNLSLDRSGNNTLTLPDANTYTGATIVRGGGLTLQDAGSLTTSSIMLNFGTLTLNNASLNPLAGLNPVRFAASTPLTMQGGTWTITPGGSVDNTTTVNTVTILAGGANTITAQGVTGGTNIVNIGNLVLPAGTGTTLNFASDPGSATNGALPASSGAQVMLTQLNGATPTNNSFLGANVIINSNEYGVYNTVQGVIRYGGTAVTGGSVPAYAAALASGNNLPNNISSTGADVAISANTTIGALRMTGGATRAITFTAGTEVLNLALGGLLRSNEAFALNVGTTALRGVLTTGGTATTGTTDLIEWHNQNTVTINSVIANNGLGNLTRFVKSGPGATTLTAANTYTGGTVVNAGTLTINATAGAGTVVIPGDVMLNNANLTMSTNPGQIAATSNVTINGSGVLTLTGANTLNSLVFNNTGGNATPTVTIGTTSLTLSSLTPITVTNDSYSFTPTIAGTLLTLQDGATITTSGLSPDSLIISAPISTTGSTMAITKMGAGSLVLSSTTSAFANGFNLAQGSLIFAAGSTGTPPAVTAGPIGTGTLALANGVAILGDGTARTIGNAVSVAGNFTFGTRDTDSARANAGNNLTLSGVVTLAAGAHTIEVGGLLMVGTISGKLTGGTNLTKTGAGTLVLSSTANDFGGTITINAGTLQLGAAGVLPDASALTILSGAALNINGLAETIGSLAGAGLVTNSGAAATLTTGSDNTDTTFSGMISNGTNALNLVKTGTGTQTLTGANSYTGTTTVSAGTLRFARQVSLYNNLPASWTAANLVVNSGATVIFNVGGMEEFTSADTTTLLTNLTTVNNNGLKAGSTIAFDTTNAAGGSFTITAVIKDSVGTGGGAVGLTKLGDNTLVLTNTETYTGATNVLAGTLQVGDGSTGNLNGTGQVSVSGTGTTLSGSGTIAGGTIIGSGSILAPGVGTTATSNKTLTFTAASPTLTVDDGGQIELSITAPTTQATGVFFNGVYNAGGNTYANALLYLQGDGSGDLAAWNSNTPGDHDFINLGSGSLSLGTGVGTIKLLSNSYSSPNYGDVFNLLDWSSFSGSFNAGTGFTSGGTFADFELPNLSSFNLAWDTSAFTTYGILVVVPEPSRALLLLFGLLGLMLRRRRRR